MPYRNTEQHNHTTNMSRYNSYNGSGVGSSTSSGDFDDITLKLQKFSAISVVGQRVNAFDSQYGDTFVVGFEDVKVLDGIVFQRDDKPDTWKVFSPGKFFNVDPDTGLVLNKDGNEMSADEILNHPRVLGFSETFGGNDYFYTPVGVAVEAADDIAVNNDLDVETEDNAIVVGEVSMLLKNKSWVRTLAKLLTAEGDDIINDNGESREDGNPKYEQHGWLTTMEPTLRDGIEGREMELFVIEETQEFNGEDVTYSTPILLDKKTGERITIDNFGDDADGDDAAADTAEEPAASEPEPEAEPEPAKATDGGAAAQPAEPETDEADEAEAEDGDANVPAVLDDLINYFARTDGSVTPDELREFAEDEVDNPDDVDWEAAAAEVEARA